MLVSLPRAIPDLLAQRRRIAFGHRWLLEETGYSPSSRSSVAVGRAVLLEVVADPAVAPGMAALGAIEATARLLARFDRLRGASYGRWPKIAADLD